MEDAYVWILDTTLRDGLQSSSVRVDGKVAFARQLEQLGVDVIEAGYAAASSAEFDGVAAVAAAVERPVVLSLARATEAEVVSAVRSVEGAEHPGVHLFTAVAKRKRAAGLAESVDAASGAVRAARRYVDHVEFTVADAARLDPAWLIKAYGAAIAAGATVINVPDTAGHALPDEFGALVQHVITHTPDAERVRWSAHCHNHLGLAVANSLAAVRSGVRQVECAVEGVGPAGGNTSLAHVAAAIAARAEAFRPLRTAIVAPEMTATSRLLHQIHDVRIAHATAPRTTSPRAGVDAIGSAPWNQ